MAREKPNIPGLTRQPSSAQPWVLGSGVTQSGAWGVTEDGKKPAAPAMERPC